MVRRLAIAAVLALGLSACVHLPRVELPRIDHRSLLTPEAPTGGTYVVGDGDVVSYHGLEGARIDVQYLSDEALNEMFPDDSHGGTRSTNPYTYGDWVDPNLGHTPNRFTVFRVTVNNYTHAKVLLDPGQAILLTDRGEFLESFAVSPGGGRQSLEGYYRKLRGISGNEHYRFAKRIGIVRSSIYGDEELIYKGENYAGLIVFPPLHDEVASVRLVLKEVVYRFDAADKPLASTDVRFDSRRRIVHEVRTAAAAAHDRAAATTRLVLRGPVEVRGHIPGDLARDAGAINAVVDRHKVSLNRCFQTEYDKGQAVAGDVEVQFSVRVNGVVDGAALVRSSVRSEAVEQCVMADVSRWLFPPAGQFPPEEEATPESAAGTRPAVRTRVVPALTTVTIVYPLQFEAAGP